MADKRELLLKGSKSHMHLNGRKGNLSYGWSDRSLSELLLLDEEQSLHFMQAGSAFNRLIFGRPGRVGRQGGPPSPNHINRLTPPNPRQCAVTWEVYWPYFILLQGTCSSALLYSNPLKPCVLFRSKCPFIKFPVPFLHVRVQGLDMKWDCHCDV